MAILQPDFALIRLYDHLEKWWESQATMRRVAALTMCIYILGLLAIEAKRVGLLPEEIAVRTPDSHIWAIHLAFTVILGVEVISLIFCIASSFTRSVGKQLEIVALILLRNAFKELGQLAEPINVAEHWEPIVHIGCYALGALLVFIALRVFLYISPVGHLIRDPEMRKGYASIKKLLSLLLLLITLGIGVYDLWILATTGEQQNFFGTVYTVLIFADIALVLLAQRYMPCFHAVFRNSGFVIATLLMRLALSATAPLDVFISVFAGGYVILLVWGMNNFERLPEHGLGRVNLRANARDYKATPSLRGGRSERAKKTGERSASSSPNAAGAAGTSGGTGRERTHPGEKAGRRGSGRKALARRARG